MVYSLVFPTGAHSERDYDGVARLKQTSLQDPQANVLDQYEYAYDLGSQRTQQVYTAGNYVDSHNYSHYTDYTYDDIGQLKTAKATDRAYDYQAEQYVERPRLQEQFGYGYDAAWYYQIGQQRLLEVASFYAFQSNFRNWPPTSYSGSRHAGMSARDNTMSAGDNR